MAGTVQFNGEVGNIESNINKVDSFDEGISEDAAKQKYPSVECLKNMVHIVESGTSGIWSYRKWSDGTAECWGKDYSVVDLTLSATTSAGTNCYTNKDAIILTLPDSLFIDTPSATVGIVRGTSWLPFVACMRTLTKDSIELRYFMFTASTSEFIRNETGEFEPTCLHLIGRWK